MRLGDFKHLFKVSGLRRLRGADIGLRLFAVVLAIGLWIFVNTAEQHSFASLTVPITYGSLSQGMVIVNHPPAFVKIEVTGPRSLLSLLDPERLTLKIDLRGVAAGQSEFKIYPAMFNVGRNTAVTSISPDQLSLDIDRLVTRDVPVHLAVQGKVDPGYTITSVDITPPTVTIAGPSRFVAPLTSVSTEAFDLKGLTSDTDRSVDIVPPNPALGFSTGHVDARVNVAEAMADREFRAVDVEVKDSGFKYRVDPKQVTLTIRGPAVKLAGLAPKGMVYVDAKGVAPGSHELPLQVTLPDGMQLLHQSPDKVKLRMYREKLTTTADEHPS
ncbi:MAG: CdaR family protein [Candidatus Binatus sp.]|jgi:YbbR domain-containing protein|uniref:CdaR family protein n=1 Tax=Candidatus Binatus sp. TaxID=2811406 RepID=UPI003C99AB2A